MDGKHNTMNKNKLLLTFLLFLLLAGKTFSQELVIDQMNRIQRLIQMGNYESAIEYAKDLGDDVKCGKNEILGYCYYQLSKYKSAIVHYEQYIEYCESSSVQRINLGDSYSKTNQPNKAKEQFLFVNQSDRNYSLAQFNIGVVEYNQGNKEEAVTRFTAAINNTKNGGLDFDYVEMQIKALVELKKFDSAFESIDSILKIWRKDTLEYKYTLIIKSTIFGGKKEYQKAIKMLDDVIDSGIDHEAVLFDAYYFKLDFYSKMKNMGKACIMYQKLKDLRPEAQVLKKYKCG